VTKPLRPKYKQDSYAAFSATLPQTTRSTPSALLQTTTCDPEAAHVIRKRILSQKMNLFACVANIIVETKVNCPSQLTSTIGLTVSVLLDDVGGVHD